MKRHLAIITALLFVSATFGAYASVVHAQTANGPGSGTTAASGSTNPNASAQGFTPGNGSLLMQGGSGANGSCTTPPCADTAANPSSSGGVANQDATTQTGGQFTPPGGGTDSSTYGAVMTWIMGLFAWLLGVAMVTLDNAVYYTVITMGNYLHNISAVGVAWRILRDIGNVVLIFGFLAIGISTIIGYDFYGSRTKMLPTLLIAAVFINFSLFVSEAVVDVGNLFATEFYAQINGGQIPTQPEQFDLNSVHNEGISNKLMSQLGMQNIYKPSGTIFTKDTPWYIGFMGILLFLTAAFVIFSLAFILIARFVVLIVLIIVAPVGFAGLAVPKLEKTAKEWWSKLFSHTITAPILLLMLYVALAVITDANFMTGFGVTGSNDAANVWAGWATGNIQGFAGVMISFLVAMGLLGLVVIVSKSISAAGGEWATSWGGKLTFGATAFVGRRTIGKASHYASRKITKTRWLQNDFGRLLKTATDYGAKGTYDLRAQGALGGALKAAKINAGDASKANYDKLHSQSVKDREAYLKSLKGKDATEKQTKRKDEATAAVNQAQAEKTAAEAALKAAQDEKASALEQTPEMDRKIAEAQSRVVKSDEGLTKASSELNAALEDIKKTTWSAEEAQLNYVKSLQSASGVFKAGTIGNASAFGGVLGAPHGAVIGSVLGTGAAAGTGVGFLGGAGAYMYSAAPGANKEIVDKFLSKLNKKVQDKKEGKKSSDSGELSDDAKEAIKAMIKENDEEKEKK